MKRSGGGAIRRAYDFGQSNHALRAWNVIRGSAGNESELFGIMTTKQNLNFIDSKFFLKLIICFNYGKN